MMYIEMIFISKRYVYVERAGMWQNHLEETSNMLLNLMSAGLTRYMSCLPLYLKEMSELNEKHPDIYLKFEGLNSQFVKLLDLSMEFGLTWL